MASESAKSGATRSSSNFDERKMKRSLPWYIAASAYIAPPVWAYLTMERDAAEQKVLNGWACGNPALAMIFLACMVSGLLSLSATLIRGWMAGWWKDVSCLMTGFELTVLMLPLVGAIGFATSIFVA